MGTCFSRMHRRAGLDRTGLEGRPYMRRLSRVLLVVGLTVAAQYANAQSRWVATWAPSQQIPEAQNALPPEDMRDMTMRQIVHVSLGGASLRLYVSNAFGTEPLHFTSVRIARPIAADSSKIDPGSGRPLSFASSADVMVPAGAEYISDPIDYAVAPLSNLAITFHLDAAPVVETSHPGSRATSYYVHGDLVSAADLPDAKRVDHWYQ